MSLMTIHLRIWRQEHKDAEGQFTNYTLDKVNEHMSFWRCWTFLMKS